MDTYILRSFIQLIGDLSELQEKNYEDQDKRGFSRPSSTANLSDKEGMKMAAAV